MVMHLRFSKDISVPGQNWCIQDALVNQWADLALVFSAASGHRKLRGTFTTIKIDIMHYSSGRLILNNMSFYQTVTEYFSAKHKAF